MKRLIKFFSFSPNSKQCFRKKSMSNSCFRFRATVGAEDAQMRRRLNISTSSRPAEIFGKLLPKQVETQIYRAMLESVASEQGSRMTAMDSASKNAGELIDTLTLNMNRIRQAAITKEIIEVVSGAAAQ